MDSLSTITTQLIRFRSIDSPQYRSHLHSIVQWIERRLKKYPGVFIKKFFVDKKPGLIVTFRPKYKTPRVFLNGHLDVVSAEPDQFQPKMSKGRIYGRGAHDMKGACAVMIALIEYFAKQEKKPDVGFMFVTDEEFYGAASKKLFSLHYHPELFMTLEPTNFDIVTETKGMLWMEGTIPGIAAHGSTPWLGQNPIESFSKGLQKFLKFFPTLTKKQWRTTANIGEVHSGDCYNRVPPSLTFKIDVRYIAKDNPYDLMKKIKHCFPKNTHWIIQRCDQPHTKARDIRLIQRLKKIIDDLDIQTQYTRAPFCTDARFFAAGGINCAVLGARGGGMHGADEWVDSKSLQQLFEALRIFCSTFRS